MSAAVHGLAPSLAAAHHELLPLARVTLLPCLRVGGRELRWIEFSRNRKDDPPRLGYGLELEFAEPLARPIALGYGCHFGSRVVRAS